MKKKNNTKYIFGKYTIQLNGSQVKVNVDRFINEIVPILKTFGLGYNKWIHICFSKTKDNKFYIFRNGFNIASTPALDLKIKKICNIVIKGKEWSVYFWIRFTDTKKLGYWIDDFTVRIKPFNPKYEIGDKNIEWSDCKWTENFIPPTKGD